VVYAFDLFSFKLQWDFARVAFVEAAITDGMTRLEKLLEQKKMLPHKPQTEP
jgi:hypothetical protein